MVQFEEFTVDILDKQTVMGFTVRKLSISNAEVEYNVYSMYNDHIESLFLLLQ